MDQEGKIETPAQFLDALGRELKESPGSDGDLTDILITQLLKVAPAKDAVAEAKKAILHLAAERATALAKDGNDD